MHKRGRGITTLRLTVPKLFVEEPFCVSENCWYRKILGIRERERGGISRFSVDFFCLTVPKSFVREPLFFQKVSGIEIFHVEEGGASRFCRKFFVSQDRNEKLRRGTLLCFIKIFGTTETRTRTYRFRTLLSYPLGHGNHWN